MFDAYWGLYYSSVWAIVLANILLYAFYKAFRTNWPEHYFALNNKIDSVLSVSLIRVILFRFLPPLIAVTMVNVMLLTGEKFIIVLTVGLFAGFIHSMSTNGKAISLLLSGNKEIKRYINLYSQILLHIISIFLVLLASFISSFLVQIEFIQKITPTLSGLIDNIWSSIITGIFVVVIYDLYKQNDTNVDKIIDTSREKISKEIWNIIQEFSITQQANTTLVQAICIVENIQRPKWVRKLEWLKSFIWKKGTYGIMQTSSDRYLSDNESIEKSIITHFKNTISIRSEVTIRELIKKYNDNPDYVDLVLLTMTKIDPSAIDYLGRG